MKRRLTLERWTCQRIWHFLQKNSFLLVIFNQVLIYKIITFWLLVCSSLSFTVPFFFFFLLPAVIKKMSNFFVFSELLKIFFIKKKLMLHNNKCKTLIKSVSKFFHILFHYHSTTLLVSCFFSGRGGLIPNLSYDPS